MNISTLLWITISASALDSLNPIAIAQQFVLQGLVDKKRKIIAFIAAIGITNFTVGLLVYYGLAAVFLNLLDRWIVQNHNFIRIAAVIAGCACIIVSIWFIYKRWIKNKQVDSTEGEIKKSQNLSTPALFLMGVMFCLFELTSALPYFAYLTLMVQYKLSILNVVLIMLLYNIIYSMPLILLLIVSVFFEEKLEKIYSIFKKVMAVITRFVPPVVLATIGGISILFGFQYI